MKDTLKRIAFAIFASLFVLTSCTQLTDPVTVYSGNGDKNVEVMGETTNITINVSSSENIIKFGTASTARTITPPQLQGDAEGSKFYLFGKNVVTGADINPEEITFVADGTNKTKGTVSKLFTRSNYELTLVFLTADNITAMGSTVSKDLLLKFASLKASTDVDLRYNEKVYFYLTPNNNSNSGNVAINIVADGWNPTNAEFDGYSMTTAIYSFDDLTTPILGTDVDLWKGDIGAGSDKLTNVEKLYEKAGIEAGTYELRIDFKKDGKTYSASEDIVVLSNQTTTGTFKVGPVIGKTPAAPASLHAVYKDPTTSIEDSVFYNVGLYWLEAADKPINNESYFELETIEIKDGHVGNIPNMNSDNDWTTAIGTYSTNATYKNYDNQGSDTSTKWANSPECSIFAGGKLNKNSKFVIMQLPLGSRYYARIRSVNDAGASAWTYLTINGAAIDAADFPPDLNGYVAFTGADTINRFKLRYNLNGGKVDSTLGTGTLDLVTFHTKTTTPVTIATPKTSQSDDTSTLAVIKEYNDKVDYWQNWTYPNGTVYTTRTTDPDTGDVTVTNSDWETHKNLTLVANYDSVSEMGVELIQPADYIIQSTQAKIEFYKDTTLLGTQPTLTAGKYEVSLANANKFRLSLETPYQYKKVEYSIARTNGNTEEIVYETKVNSAGNPIVYTYTSDTTDNGLISFQSLLPGIYEVQWKAWHSTRGNTPYTYHVYVQITE